MRVGFAGLQVLVSAALFVISAGLSAQGQDGPPGEHGHRWNEQIVSTKTIRLGEATVQVDFAAGALDLSPEKVMPWVQRAADAVVVYYGRFPVSRARVLVVPVDGRHGIVQGTTWGDMRGFPGLTRIRLGQHTTEHELTEDWTMTHELVHMAFPSLPDEQHWMEEGLATYIEPIARVQNGELDSSRVWRDMMDGMPKGEPETGDQGMDRTHTWGRTYWGGALFCLVADVNIRKQTKNQKGLQDALRAIVAAGGTIDQEWSLAKALKTGDEATKTTVLTDLYGKWKDSAAPVDLDQLWKDLGVHSEGGRVRLDPDAPLASIREAIMSRPGMGRPANPTKPAK